MTRTIMGLRVALIKMRLRFLPAATAIIMASAVAVAPSYIDAFDTSMPVSSDIMLWYSKMY